MENKYIEEIDNGCCDGCESTYKIKYLNIQKCDGCDKEMVVSYVNSGEPFEKFYHNRVCFLKSEIKELKDKIESLTKDDIYNEKHIKSKTIIYEWEIETLRKELKKWKEVLGENYGK